MLPALYVDIDCDLYSAAVTVLEFMFSSGLIVPGTVLGYDDWASGGKSGEQAAHAQAVEKYRVVTEPVPGCAACFEVISVGAADRRQ